MKSLCCDVLMALEGHTLATAESCTGGGIGAAITAIPGSSSVFKGGIISYCNEIKHSVLGVGEDILSSYGAVSAPVAEAMAVGVRNVLRADIAVSVTGLAGPGGDEFGNPVGTVFIGYADEHTVCSALHHFSGNRDQIQKQATKEALELILKMQGESGNEEN